MYENVIISNLRSTRADSSTDQVINPARQTGPPWVSIRPAWPDPTGMTLGPWEVMKGHRHIAAAMTTSRQRYLQHQPPDHCDRLRTSRTAAALPTSS